METILWSVERMVRVDRWRWWFLSCKFHLVQRNLGGQRHFWEIWCNRWSRKPIRLSSFVSSRRSQQYLRLRLSKRRKNTFTGTKRYETASDSQNIKLICSIAKKSGLDRELERVSRDMIFCNIAMLPGAYIIWVLMKMDELEVPGQVSGTNTLLEHVVKFPKVDDVPENNILYSFIRATPNRIGPPWY